MKNLLPSEDAIGLSMSLSDKGLNARIMSGQLTLDALMVYSKKVMDALEPVAAKSRLKQDEDEDENSSQCDDGENG